MWRSLESRNSRDEHIHQGRMVDAILDWFLQKSEFSHLHTRYLRGLCPPGSSLSEHVEELLALNGSLRDQAWDRLLSFLPPPESNQDIKQYDPSFLIPETLEQLFRRTILYKSIGKISADATHLHGILNDEVVPFVGYFAWQIRSSASDVSAYRDDGTIPHPLVALAETKSDPVPGFSQVNRLYRYQGQYRYSIFPAREQDMPTRLIVVTNSKKNTELTHHLFSYPKLLSFFLGIQIAVLQQDRMQLIHTFLKNAVENGTPPSSN